MSIRDPDSACSFVDARDLVPRRHPNDALKGSSGNLLKRDRSLAAQRGGEAKGVLSVRRHRLQYLSPANRAGSARLEAAAALQEATQTHLATTSAGLLHGEDPWLGVTRHCRTAGAARPPSASTRVRALAERYVQILAWRTVTHASEAARRTYIPIVMLSVRLQNTAEPIKSLLG